MTDGWCQRLQSKRRRIQNYFRDYDYQTGRYVQSDPIGLVGGINTYAYAANDPVFYSDSTGLFLDETGQFLQTCVKQSVSVGTRVLGGAGMLLTPGSMSQCQDLNPRPECPDDCAKIEAEITALATELRLRYLAAQRDPLNLYDRARTTPLSRRSGSWPGHRQQFIEKQGRLQRLIGQADTKGCRVSPEDRLLATSPYPDIPVGR